MIASLKETSSDVAPADAETTSGKFTSDISNCVPGTGYNQQKLPSTVDSGGKKTSKLSLKHIPNILLLWMKGFTCRTILHETD